MPIKGFSFSEVCSDGAPVSSGRALVLAQACGSQAFWKLLAPQPCFQARASVPPLGPCHPHQPFCLDKLVPAETFQNQAVTFPRDTFPRVEPEPVCGILSSLLSLVCTAVRELLVCIILVKYHNQVHQFFREPEATIISTHSPAEAQ